METFKDDLAALQGKQKAQQTAQRQQERLWRKEGIQRRRIEGLIGLHEIADADQAGKIFIQAAKAIRRRNERTRLDRYLAAIDGGDQRDREKQRRQIRQRLEHDNPDSTVTDAHVATEIERQRQAHYLDERRAIVKLVVAAYDGDTPADIGQMYLGYRSVFLPGRFLSATARFVEDFCKAAPVKTAEARKHDTSKQAAPSKCGPEAPNLFWWNGKRCELDIEEGSKPWNLLVFLWGKESATVSDVGYAVWKSKRIKYNSMKPSVTRLNQAIGRAGLPFTWSKKPRQNALFYVGPTPQSSVAK